MRTFNLLAGSLALVLAACRGEPVPRDYTNHPPAMTHPAKNAQQTPGANGMPGAAPEPSKGAEGKTVDPTPPTLQNAPANDTSAPPVTSATTT